jgi:hypothetical protein
MQHRFLAIDEGTREAVGQYCLGSVTSIIGPRGLNSVGLSTSPEDGNVQFLKHFLSSF